MRIALLTYSTRPRGGVVHTLALAEALARRGEDVTVVTLGRHGDTGFFRPVDPAVSVQIVPFPDGPADETVGGRVQRSVATLAAGFDRAGFDVVHAEDCISANAAPGSIRTVHHIDHFETAELVRCHERAIQEPVAHVCVSPAVAEELLLGWGKVATVIPNGVEWQRFALAASDRPDAVAARRWWQGRIGGPYVLTVGGIEPRKGTIALVEAFRRLSDAWPAARLVIAGGETLFDYRAYRARFDDCCAELGVDPLVLGPVAHDRLPSLMAAASAFAFPSEKEGFGLVALEAAAAGVPLVVSDLPVFRNVLGRAAHYASDPAGLAAGLLAAVSDPDPVRLAEGRRVAASYSWDAAAAAHQRLYAAISTYGASR